MTAEFSAVQAKFQEAFACHQKGQSDAARRLYEDVLALAPQHFDALHFSGVLAAQSGAFAQAADLIGKALALNPNHASARYNLGLALGGLKRNEEALAAYDQTLALNPDHAGAHHNRGTILRMLGRPDEALAASDRACALHPDHIDGLVLRAAILGDMKRFADALAVLDQILARKPDHMQVLLSRAGVLKQLGRLEDACAAYDKVLAANQNVPEVLNERGIVQIQLKRNEDAIAGLDQAIRLKPEFADAHANRGIALAAFNRFDEALASYDKAIVLKPTFAEAYHNRAVTLAALGHLEAAAAGYRKATELRPDLTDAFNNLGFTLLALKHYAQAEEAFDAVLAKNPSYAFVSGMHLHTRAYMCQWDHFEQDRDILAAAVARGEKVAPPLPVMTLLDSPAAHRKAAEVWAAARHPENPILGAIPKRAFKPADKIRIGYFSMDFRDHAVALLVAGLIEQHDRTRFEVYGFSFGRDTQDDMRKRFEKAFDHFLDVRAVSDRAVAELARQHGIDIAIDLAGYTGDTRPDIFALRAAPVQVNYLGYPGTMGAPYMDYIIADQTVIPAEDRGHYVEKVVWMPASYQINDSKRVVSDRVFSRRELGLPENGFVFCCFNSTHKILPDVFAAWMQILRAVDGSVLWLLEDQPAGMENLRRYAAGHGVDSTRLVFAPRIPIPEYMARQRAADLFLDTLPYNAHTTASDALWVGLPVLTCRGHSFPGRVAASLLKAIGLPELMTETRADYVALAIALARDPARLADIKAKLARNRFVAPLFDTAGFARHLEDAYHVMHVRYRNGEAPDHITVTP